MSSVPKVPKSIGESQRSTRGKYANDQLELLVTEYPLQIFPEIVPELKVSISRIKYISRKLKNE